LAIPLPAEEVFKKVSDAIMAGDEDAARVAAEEAINAGFPPFEVITRGIGDGLKTVGQKFEAKEAYYPDLVLSGETARITIDTVRPYLNIEKVAFAGTYVIGTVEGDLHDIGKCLVATMLKAGGFKVVNLGVDIPPSKFVEAAKKYNADVVGSSAALAGGTKMKQKEIEQALREAGIREKIKTMVGGIVTDETWAREIGADAWGEDCLDALKKAEELMKKLKEERKK
jgi:trimethylamine corrinoid protein